MNPLPHKKKSKKALIYCADITGHRHLYSAYLIEYYLEHGYEIYFYFAGRIAQLFRNGKKKYKNNESLYLNAFKENNQVHFRSICRKLNDAKNESSVIRALQRDLEPEISFFVDGDILRWFFLKQLLPGQPRLSGRNYCIICLSEFIYAPKGKLRVLKELKIFIQHLVTDRKDLAGRGSFIRAFPLLAKFFFRLFCRFNLVTAAFCLDPQLIKSFKSKMLLFLPELMLGNLEAKVPKQKSEFYEKVKSQYCEFLNRHKGKHVLLMFGDLEPRKGFDLLIRLAAHEPDCVCVRFGRTKTNYRPTWESIMSKEKLLVEERIFELDTYIESEEFIDFIFSSVSFMILPYRSHQRSSGMLTAVLQRELPILTGDGGVMGSMVRQYGVGSVFKTGDFPDLLKKFPGFKENHKNYLENIKKFNKIYSREASDEALSATLAS